MLLGGFVLALTAFGLHSLYNAGVNAERARLLPRLNASEVRAGKAEDELLAARERSERQAQAHRVALAALASDQAALVAKSTGALDKSERAARKIKEQLNDLFSFVSPQADSACTVPVGFVRLHDVSAQERSDPARPTEGPAVSERRPSDANAPSGIALSAVAATVSTNYAECTARLEVIDAWQHWYEDSLSAWRRATVLQGEFALPETLNPERSRP